MSRICETLGQLVNGPATATAILMREDDDVRRPLPLRLRPGGIQQERLAARRVVRRAGARAADAPATSKTSRCGPDLKVPQPATASRSSSVLAAPLSCAAGRSARSRSTAASTAAWSDEQIALVESLAAQTSISLENAELFAGDRATSDGGCATMLDTRAGRHGHLPTPTCTTSASTPPARAMLGVPPNAQRRRALATRPRWTAVSTTASRSPPSSYPLVRAVRSGERVYRRGDGGGPARRPAAARARQRRAVPRRRRQDHGGVSAFVDITQLKTLQRELDMRRREAEEASVRKTRFLAAASHDIRTPGQRDHAAGRADPAHRRQPGDGRRDPASWPRSCSQSATSLVNLVSNVLDVTRFDTGKLELQETEFPLAQLLDEEVRQVLPLAQAKRLALDVEPPPATLVAPRRPHQARPRPGQPAGQRDQVHRRGADPRRARGTRRRRRRADPRQRHRHRHQRREPGAHLRRVLPARPTRSAARARASGWRSASGWSKRWAGRSRSQSDVGKGSTFTVTLPATSVIPRPDPDGAAAAARA